MEDIMNDRGNLEFQTASVVLLWVGLNAAPDHRSVLLCK